MPMCLKKKKLQVETLGSAGRITTRISFNLLHILMHTRYQVPGIILSTIIYRRAVGMLNAEPYAHAP